MNYLGFLGKINTRKCEAWVVKDIGIRNLNYFVEKNGLNYYVRLEKIKEEFIGQSIWLRRYNCQHLVESKSSWKLKENNFNHYSIIFDFDSISPIIKCASFCLMEFMANPNSK